MQSEEIEVEVEAEVELRRFSALETLFRSLTDFLHSCESPLSLGLQGKKLRIG